MVFARARERRSSAIGEGSAVRARALVVMKLVRYFAHGTTQKGFAHHRRFARLLRDPVGRFRTVSAHAVVVPRQAACRNPGCQYVHRMAALVAEVQPLRVEAELFLIGPEAVAVMDELETGSAGGRTSVSSSPPSAWTAGTPTRRRRTSLASLRAGGRSSRSAEQTP